MTRTVKITNNGKPSLAEDSGSVPIGVTGITLDKATAAVAVGATTQLVASVLPASASDSSFRVATSDLSKSNGHRQRQYPDCHRRGGRYRRNHRYEQ
jgi:uncharacterized protein YjdB